MALLKQQTSSATTRHDRQDSAISAIEVRTDISMASGEVTIEAFELPRPAEPGRLSPHRRLLRKCHIKQHPKTLHELVSSACQATCSFILRRSKLSIGENLLVTDPAVVDLLLTCISSVDYNRRFTGLNLLPGCPVSNLRVRTVINKLPALSSLGTPPTSPGSETTSTTSTSSTTLPAPADLIVTLSFAHQRLLNWLLQSPFCILSSVTPEHPKFSFPSITSPSNPLHAGCIQAFVVTKQPANKEALFSYHAGKQATIPVFHGTHPSRLPLILSQGLKNMSGTRYQSNGKAMGRGIYLATDVETSFSYAHPAVKWKSSDIFNGPLMLGSTDTIGYGSSANRYFGRQTVYTEHDKNRVKVLLGCELAGEQRGKYTYVIPDEGKVVVRFVFLISGGIRDLSRDIMRDLETAIGVLREMRGA